MKTYFKKSFAVLMAFVFFTNITFAHSVDFHLCQGELQSIALFGQKATCTNMVENQAPVLRSCCDKVNNIDRLSFKQKSCCDNLQITQDTVFANSSHDFDYADAQSFDFIHEFSASSFDVSTSREVVQKVEIPPPPNLRNQHSQENLQVFII